MSNTVKTIVAVIVVALLAGGAYIVLNKDNDGKTSNSKTTSSSTGSVNTPSEQPKQKDEAITVDAALAKLKAGGLTVSDKQGAYYQVVGAENGDKVDVNGTNVEIYEFKTDKAATDAVAQLKSDDNTVYAKSSAVVLIHSTDQAVVSKIQNIL